MVGREPIAALATGCMRSVRTLDLMLWPELSQDLARVMASAFDAMPNLVAMKLKLYLPHKYPAGRTAKTAPDLRGIHWRLPLLQTLAISSTYCDDIFSLPTVKCGSLTSLQVQARPTTFATLLALCIDNLNLTSIMIKMEHHANEQYEQQVDRRVYSQFTEALRTRHWPQLASLCFFPFSDHSAVVIDALADAGKHQWQELTCTAADNTQVISLLSACDIRRCNIYSTEGPDAQPRVVRERAAKTKVQPKLLAQLTELRLNVAEDSVFSAFLFVALQKLKLKGPFVALSRLDLVLDACPSLRELELKDFHMGSWAVPKSWRAQPARPLRSFTIFQWPTYVFDARSPKPSDQDQTQPPFDDMHNLTKLLLQFPNLEKLCLHAEGKNLMPSFIDAWLKTGIRCSELLDLELSLSDKNAVTQDMYQAMLHSLPKLRKFTCDFGVHSKTLRYWAEKHRPELEFEDEGDPMNDWRDYDSDGHEIDRDSEGDEAEDEQQTER